MTKQEFLEAAREHLAHLVKPGDWTEWVRCDSQFAAILDRQVAEQIAYLSKKLER